ncbi:hypothetical protein CZ814_00041 [Photobacterium toruni]|uniref:Transposase n=1 Tax=Photobacterium toruni TaxID=1935446 RepID=A0A1T4JT02_9GAMM|nr:hypothetical protein CZ814_00041 [Photobacterium toruni]
MDKWVRQLKEERQGKAPKASPMTPEQIEIPELKKKLATLDVRLIEQFSLIEKLKKSHSITTLCKELGVHRSSSKYWQRLPKSISIELIKLRFLIKEVHAASKSSAGTRSIAGMVTAQGIPLS